MNRTYSNCYKSGRGQAGYAIGWGQRYLAPCRF